MTPIVQALVDGIGNIRLPAFFHGRHVTVIDMTDVPRGLTPSIVDRGTFYGPLSAVPEDWECWQHPTERWEKAYDAVGGERNRVVQCRPMPDPAVETALFWETGGRTLANGKKVLHALAASKGWYWLIHEGDARTRIMDPTEPITVLVDDD